MTVMLALALLSLAVWLALIFGRGFFWLARERDEPPAATPSSWPRVAAVIPARDEADMIGDTIAALLRQDYPGPFSIILVDDGSTDGTGEVARAAAEALEGFPRANQPDPARSCEGGNPEAKFGPFDSWVPACAGMSGVGAARPQGADSRLTVVTGRQLPANWTGKLFALKQGADWVAAAAMPPDYLLFTDADILHAPDSVRRLVARARADRIVLVSLMAKLRCESFAERALVPAFIFFFQMLYPFAWVNDPRRRTAAAAGGCVLLDRRALEAAGGIAAVRNELIDDCALGRLMKAQGPIRLCLTERVVSRRAYPRLGDIHRMVARSAYAQLRYSPFLLAGTMLGMAVTYLAAPLLALFGHGAAQIVGAAVWLMMALSFQPVLAFYRASPAWGLALPAIAAAYLLFTIDSARLYWRGRGGEWKGRAQALRSPSP
ncbi:MAG: glycosyltransferase [Methylobacteriaceae bacterium]|nr:glycosyltransferase [Methylobacteriaceae bacterium]